MPIEGPLRELSIEDVLQMLDLARKTGILTVRSQRMMDEAAVHLSEGEVVHASRKRSMRLLGQQLLRVGKLKERDLERALELQRQDPTRRLGSILVELGSVDRDDLDRQLRFQIEEIVYDLLAWQEGYFRFEETVDAPAGPVRVRIESLLMEGARRIDEWRRLESRVPGPDAVPVLAPADESRALIDLRPEEWEVLAEVDGERGLRAIAAELGRSVFDVAKTVYALASMHVLSVRGHDAGGLDQGLRPLLDELVERLDLGDADVVERRARELQEAYPDEPELPLLAGRALVAQGRLRPARDAFDRAVGLDPLSVDAHYQLGLAAAKTGDLRRAAEAWHTFLRLARDGDRRRHVEAALAAMDELQRAIESAPTE